MVCTGVHEYYTPLMSLSRVDPKILIAAHAIYTDDQALAMPPGWRLMPVADFHRSLLIELKQRDLSLYRVEPAPTL